MKEATRTFAPHAGAKPKHDYSNSPLPGLQPEPTVQVQGWCSPCVGWASGALHKTTSDAHGRKQVGLVGDVNEAVKTRS